MLVAPARLRALLFLFAGRSLKLNAALPLLGSHHSVVQRNFVFNNASGSAEIFSPDNQMPIPQGLGTDGSGSGFSSPAIVWIVFCFVVGSPMALAGIRGWKCTIGISFGLCGALCFWASFINSVNNIGISDNLLTAFVLGFFLAGFVLGLFDFTRVAGIAMVGVTGGIAFGVRIVLLKEGLLVSSLSLYDVNWVIITLFGFAGVSLIIIGSTQRTGILLGSASVGTFLVFLGVDLIIEKQSGLSRGLRFLFDRNVSHALDILVSGYRPALLTQILITISLLLTPILAFIQHRIFQHPFSRKQQPESALRCSSVVFLDESIDRELQKVPPRYPALGTWDRNRNENMSRFSL